MRRITSAIGIFGLAAFSGISPGGDDAPPMTGPAEARGGATIPAAAAPRAATAAPRGTSPLIRPRTVPASRPSAERPRLDPDPADAPPPLILDDLPRFATPPAADAPPPLDGPSEMRMLPERPMGGQGLSRRRGEMAAIPDDGPDPAPGLTLEPDDEPSDRAPDRKPSAPARRGLLGGLFRPPAAPRARARDAKADSPVRVEPRSDPAADAALKRRLETKVREAVGDRAGGIEVRVVDRSVSVRARASRFWNRKAVRRTIENLPALAGYKARVEVD